MSQSGSQESAELPARFVPEMSKEESLGMTIVGNMMVARIIMVMTIVKNMVVTRIVFMTLVKMTRISMIWSFPQGDVQQGESGCCGDDGDEYR